MVKISSKKVANFPNKSLCLKLFRLLGHRQRLKGGDKMTKKSTLFAEPFTDICF